MGSKTDKRIVELGFDNAEFKKGVSETLQDMKRLDNAFAFKGTKNNLKDLDNSIKNVKVENLTQGVEKVKAEFSVMSAVAFSAIQKITGAVMDMGAQVLNSFTLKPITDGFEEYNLKMNSIKTIQTNTMGAFDDSDEQLKAINSTLSELNTYADKTIYNFAEMTRNIGTFTAAGVGLEESSQAIQGISNLAAASGSSAQQASTAMYQLSQALSSGTLKLMDWRSVINAGMGGQLFQNALIRTSEAMGTGAMDAIEKQGSFNESLQEGWATAEVLTKTLRNMTLATNEMTDSEIEAARAKLSTEGYTEEMIDEIFKEANAAQEAATKVKSFQQLVDTTQEALGSGWAQSWEYIIGDISEAEDLFTWMSESINGVISGFDDYRNGVLQEWHDKGGRDDIVASLKTFADIISKLVAPIQQAFGEIFKPLTGQDLIEASKNIRNFVEGINNSLDSENGQRFLQFIHDISKGIFEVLNALGSIAFGGISKIGETISGLFNGIFNIAFGENDQSFNPILSLVRKISEVFESLRSIQTDGVDTVIDKIKTILSSFEINFDFSGIRNLINNLMSLGLTGGGVFLIIKQLREKAEKAENESSKIKDHIKDILGNVSDVFDELGKSIKRSANSIAIRNYLVGITVAVVGIATALLILDHIKIESAIPNLILLGLALSGIVGLIALIDQIGSSSGKMLASAIAITLITNAFLKIASSLALMSVINGGDASKSLDQLMVILVGIAGISTALFVLGSSNGKIIKAALAVDMIVAALFGIASSLAILSVANGGDAVKTFDQMMVMLIGLGAISVILYSLGESNGKIIKAALAVDMIVGSLIGIVISMAALSLVNGGDAQKSMDQLSVMLMGLISISVILYVLGESQGRILSAAFAVDLMVLALLGVATSLGLLSFAFGGDIVKIGQSMIVLAGGLAVLALVLNTLSAAGPQLLIGSVGLLAIAGALTILSIGLVLISKIPFLSLIGGVLGLGLALVGLAAVGVLLAPVLPVLILLSGAIALLGLGMSLAAASMLLFVTTLNMAAGMSITAFTNIANGIIAFCDKIASGGDAIIATAQIIGESVAALITSFFGRLITDIGTGISTLASAVQGKEREIFEAAKSIGAALVSGIIGGLVGIGEAVIGAITGPISDAISGSTKTMSDAGAAYSQEYVSGMLENPDQYVQAGEQAQEYANEGLESGDPGTEAGRMAGENYATAAGDEINEKLPNEVDPDEILTKATENADPEAATQWLTSMFGDSFSSEEVTSSIGAYGGSLIDTLSSGLLDGASQNQIDPMQLMTSLGIGGGALDSQSMEAGKGVGIAVSNGAAISLADNSPIESGVTAQLDAITAHTGDFESAGQANGSAYATGLNDQLASIDVSGSISAVNNSLTSTIPVAQEAGTQTGQAYGTAQIAAISEMTSLISATITENLYSAAAQADANGAGNQTGSKFGDGSSQGISAKASSITMTVANAMMQAASNSDPGGKGYQAGTWFGNGAQSGVSDSVGGMSGTVGTAFSNAASDSDPGGKGYQAGEWFARGMADGIRMYASNVADEAAKMVRDAKKAADEEQEAKSPAKEMIKSGHWFDEGMMIGIKEYSSRVSDAAGSMTGDAMDSASSAFSLMGSLVDTIDWDSNPTITPVLDLDQFRSDAASMMGFMPDSQVVSASYAGRIDAVRGEALSAQNAANQNNNTIYITLDWKAGTTPNQMVQQIADGLQTLNLTKGR